MPRAVTFNVSGTAMDVISGSSLYEQPDQRDPVAVEAAEALRYGDVSVRGRGRTYEIATTPEAALMIMDYCRTVSEALSGQSDPESQRDRVALRIVADKIYWRLIELGEQVTAQTR